MKTFKEWCDSNESLSDFLEPGDEVDEEMVDYFMDIMPPHRMSFGYLQVGEPYDHILVKDGKEEEYKAIYSTFYKKNGKWFYAGHCTTGTTMHRPSGEILFD